MNKLNIICKDGISLSATIYKSKTVKAAVLIAPATGIKRGFYHKFANHLAENGFGVITFDNRGIGHSKGNGINKVNASLENWGRLDMTAAFQELKMQFPDTTYHIVGHSAGGQLIGLMENAQQINSVFNYACSSGSIHHSRFPFILQSFFFLNIFIPLSNLFFGQTQSHWLGMGEPLPKKVASDWRRWCNGKGYVKVDLDKTIQNHQYNDLTFPTLWVHASDDEIANLDNVQDMIRVFPKIQASIKTLVPSDYDFNELGHMSFFSSKKKVLWNLAIDWLNQYS